MSLIYSTFQVHKLPEIDKNVGSPERTYEKFFDLEELHELADNYYDYTDCLADARLSVENGKVTLVILEKSDGVNAVKVFSAELNDELFHKMDVFYSHAIESGTENDDYMDKWEAMINAMSPSLADVEFEENEMDFSASYGNFNGYPAY